MPAGLKKLGLFEGGWNRQNPELAWRPDDQERPADYLVLRYGAGPVERVARFRIPVGAIVQARVGRVNPMITHDPQLTGRHDHVEQVLRRLVAGEQIRRLVERDSVHRYLPISVA